MLSGLLHELLRRPLAAAELVCSCLNWQCKPKMVHKDKSPYYFNNLQHYVLVAQWLGIGLVIERLPV